MPTFSCPSTVANYTYCCYCIWAMLMPHFRSHCAREQLNNVRNSLLFRFVNFPLSPLHIIIEPPIRDSRLSARVLAICRTLLCFDWLVVIVHCLRVFVCLGVEECVTKCRKICRRSVSSRRWKLFFLFLPICVIYFSFTTLRTLRYFQFGICVLRCKMGAIVMA